MQTELALTTAMTQAELVIQIRRLFWDRPLKAIDIDAYPQWVIKRVLDYGDLPDVQAVLRYFGRNRFFALVDGIRFDSIRAERFWQQLMTNEGLTSCTQKPCLREADKLWIG
ncbi:MAG: hypothetical protein ABIH24_10530 [Verrucomicrobiota bacterium]